MQLPDFDIGEGRWFGPNPGQTNPVHSQVPVTPVQGMPQSGGMGRLAQILMRLRQGQMGARTGGLSQFAQRHWPQHR